MPARRPDRYYIVGASVALAIAAMLGACDATTSPSVSASPAAAPCSAEDLEGSGITGRVVDPDGNPLGDILLQFDSGTGFQGSARTADDGVFRAPGVTGEFVITTVDIDHEPASRRVSVECGEMVEVELVLTPVGG